MGEQDIARTASGKDRRSERLAKALRENLKRRKAQSRNRDVEAGTPAPGTRGPFDEDSKQP
jgi:metal-responsive CopG/Arc/MetJ family transcriptional regulator